MGLVITAQAQSLLLGVIVNGQDKHMIQLFEEQDGKLSMASNELADLGIKAKVDGDTLQSLEDLENCHYTIDSGAQVVHIQVSDNALIAQNLFTPPVKKSSIALQIDTGAVVNYDSQLTRSAGATSTNNLATLRLFGGQGVLESSALQSSNLQDTHIVRLDSTWSNADATTARQWSVGDLVTGSLSWTRSVRLFGVQANTRFGLRPDLVTYPQPGISSSVAVPSTVDVYVNGMRQLSGQVSPGPFQVTQVPVSNGGGDISLVVRDASGRETFQTLPFYTSNLMLREDLDSVSLEAGNVRRHYSTQSDDYGPGAVSASYRRGITDQLTLESHVEGSDVLGMGGVGANVLVGNIGVLSGSLAASRMNGTNGNQYGVGFSHVTPLFNASISMLKAGSRFNDIASANGDQQPGTTLRGSIGGSLPGIGSLGLVFAKKRINLFDEYNLTSTNTQTSSLSLVFSRALPGGVDGSVTAFHDFTGTTGNGMFFGLSIPIGQDANVSLANSNSGGNSAQTVQIVHNAVNRGDIGWRYQQQRGELSSEDLGLSYKSPYGFVSAEAEQSAGTMAWRVGASGAISTLDGHVFVSNSIDDSFAVVDTAGIAGVEVLQENRPVGRTNNQGILFIGGLRAYETNQLSIAAGDIPLDINLSFDRLNVVPNDRSGVMARFPITQSHSAIIRILDSASQPLPPGTEVTLTISGEHTNVGYDGECFMQTLSANNTITAKAKGRDLCHASFDYTAQPGSIPSIGPLTCL